MTLFLSTASGNQWSHFVPWLVRVVEIEIWIRWTIDSLFRMLLLLIFSGFFFSPCLFMLIQALWRLTTYDAPLFHHALASTRDSPLLPVQFHPERTRSTGLGCFERVCFFINTIYFSWPQLIKLLTTPPWPIFRFATDETVMYTRLFIFLSLITSSEFWPADVLQLWPFVCARKLWVIFVKLLLCQALMSFSVCTEPRSRFCTQLNGLLLL